MLEKMNLMLDTLNFSGNKKIDFSISLNKIHKIIVLQNNMNLMSEEDLDKLLNSFEKKEDNTRDKTSEEYINSFNSIIFTDGSCIGKRKGTKFGGSGVYVHSLNETYNSLKIFEKIQQEEAIIIEEKSNKILFLGSKENDKYLEYICSEDECSSIGYSMNQRNNLKFCSRHKSEECVNIYKYEMFTPTNIRAEGYAILIALNYILYNISNTDKSLSKKKLKKYILEQLEGSKIYDINILDFDKWDYESNLFKEDENNSYNKFLIVSDSKFWIDLVSKWLSGWARKRTISDKKNVDIIIKILDILHKLNSHKCYVEFLHINGHQDKKKDSEINFYHKGNILADKLATHASQSKDNKLYVI